MLVWLSITSSWEVEVDGGRQAEHNQHSCAQALKYHTEAHWYVFACAFVI